MQPNGLNQSTHLPSRPVRLRGLDPDTVADWLDQLIPHLSGDETLPFLANVHIRLAGRRVLAFATDRYTGAIATLPDATTSETARFTIPGEFARRAITALRTDFSDSETDQPVSVDVTITDRVFGLTIHTTRQVYYETERDGWGYYDQDDTRRLAARIDPDAETLNLPRVAAEALGAPPHEGTVHINTELLARFLGYGVVVPFNPATGHVLSRAENLLARYAVHSTGRVLVLTRPDYLGFIAACRKDTTTVHAPAASLAATRTAWRDTLAAIA
jgi:hypothetical protein